MEPRVLTGWATLVLTGLGAGCAGPERGGNPPAASGGIIEARAIYRPGPYTEGFTIFPPESRREIGSAEAIATLPAKDGCWEVVFSDTPSDLPGQVVLPSEVVRFRRARDGAVSLAWVADSRRGTITEFDPPLLLMPGEMRVGDAERYTCAVKVRASDNPARLTEQGSAEIEIALLGSGPADQSVIRLRQKLTVRTNAGRSVVETERRVDASGAVRETFETLDISRSGFDAVHRERVYRSRGEGRVK